MAAQQDGTVFADEDIDDEVESQYGDEDDDDELENDDVLGAPEDDEEYLNSCSPTSSARPTPATIINVPVAVTTVTNGEPLTIVEAIGVESGFSDPKLIGGLIVQREERKPFDDSRRLFQRLWTDDDEIELLQGFLDYTTQRGSSHHHDTAFFYDQIKSKLQLDVNKNQLVEKLRRLKKKYRNVVAKISSGKEFSFKTPHDQATFEISCKIWGDTVRIGAEDNALEDEESNPNTNSTFNLNRIEVKNEENVVNCVEKKTPKSRKRSRSQSGLETIEKQVLVDGFAFNMNRNVCMTGVIEETVRSCLSPMFKELMNNAMGGLQATRGFGGVNLNIMPLSFGGSGSRIFGSGELLDEKWSKQQILELEVYSKRLELVQDQIKMTLEELKSAGGS